MTFASGAEKIKQLKMGSWLVGRSDYTAVEAGGKFYTLIRIAHVWVIFRIRVIISYVWPICEVGDQSRDPK